MLHQSRAKHAKNARVDKENLKSCDGVRREGIKLRETNSRTNSSLKVSGNIESQVTSFDEAYDSLYYCHSKRTRLFS